MNRCSLCYCLPCFHVCFLPFYQSDLPHACLFSSFFVEGLIYFFLDLLCVLNDFSTFAISLFMTACLISMVIVSSSPVSLSFLVSIVFSIPNSSFFSFSDFLGPISANQLISCSPFVLSSPPSPAPISPLQMSFLPHSCPSPSHTHQ